MDFGGLWPLANLRLKFGDYELHVPTGPDLASLIPIRAAESAKNHSLDARKQEFALLQGEVRTVADWLPDHWRLSLAVTFRGEPVGLQALIRNGDPYTVTTDSWMAEDRRQLGHGTAARRAVLMFARDYLRAVRAVGTSWPSNVPSAALNRRIGYDELYETGDEETRWSLDLQSWDEGADRPLDVVGWTGEVQFLLGLSEG